MTDVTKTEMIAWLDERIKTARNRGDTDGPCSWAYYGEEIRIASAIRLHLLKESNNEATVSRDYPTGAGL